MEIKVTKLVKGQQLDKLLTESNHVGLEMCTNEDICNICREENPEEPPSLNEENPQEYLHHGRKNP